MPDPYAQVSGVTLYHADCRDILPQLPAQTVVTDPVWPGADVPLEGRDNCVSLLEETLQNCFTAERIALHIGCRTDPRLFEAVPERFEFFRVAWLRYSIPSYQGRVLNGADVAYLYGDPPSPPEYGHLVPGEFIENGAKGKERDHPTPRKLSHVEWLVKWWSAPGDMIVDPFAGSGTTGLTAMRWDRECVLIEVKEEHCETAARALEQEAKQPTFAYA
jgi:DNA modification methylase